MKRFVTHAAVVAGMLFASMAQAAYPERLIKIVVPFPSGGPTDMVGRAIGTKLSERLGQPVIIDNKPGASTIIGTEIVAKSPADGYTLLLGSNSMALNRLLFTNAPVDVEKELTPVILVTKIPNILVVNPNVPAKNAAELIALAKSQPGKLNFASTGNGTAPHLFGELFKSMAGIDIVHVPYRGTALALTDLLSGQVEMLFDSLSTATPHLKSGSLRALGVTTSTRSKWAPDVPTLSEAGLPGYEATGWFGVAAPIKTPRDIVMKLNAEIEQILKMPDFQDKLAVMGAEAPGGPPEAFQAFIDSEVAKWGKVIRDANIKLE